MPQVSIILPIHNGASFIVDALGSVLSQSFTDFECLVVDDASTDNSCDLVSLIEDRRIRLIRSKTRIGFSGALNRAIDEADSELIARLDCDDICRPGRLAEQVGFMNVNRDVGICGSWAESFGESGRHIYETPLQHDEIIALLLFDNPFVHSTVMMRRSVLNQNSLRYDGDYCPAEDMELWSRLLKVTRGANLPRVLVDYRMTQSGMTGSMWSRMDQQAGRIAMNYLKSLGIEVDAPAMAFHRKIGRGRAGAMTSRDEFDRAADWFNTLLRANAKKRIYAEAALRKIVSEAWFRLCMNSTSLGMEALSRYTRSRFSDEPVYSRAGRAVMIWLSVLKQAWRSA